MSNKQRGVSHDSNDGIPTVGEVLDRATSHNQCLACGIGTPQVFAIYGSTNAMYNMVCSTWRDPAKWECRRCDKCGHVQFYYEPSEK